MSFSTSGRDSEAGGSAADSTCCRAAYASDQEFFGYAAEEGPGCGVTFRSGDADCAISWKIVIPPTFIYVA